MKVFFTKTRISKNIFAFWLVILDPIILAIYRG
jgi:hypothetical protein